MDEPKEDGKAQPSPDEPDFLGSVMTDPLARLAGPGIVVMSLLSDVQEMLERGNVNSASAMIERAKQTIHYYRLGLPNPLHSATVNQMIYTEIGRIALERFGAEGGGAETACEIMTDLITWMRQEGLLR